MRIYLVRHGESTHNKNKLCQGQFDSDLTDLGKEQARLLALRLKEHKFSLVYSSDLKRAKDTTMSILEHHNNVKPTFDIRLREKSQGVYENRPYHEVPFVDYSKNPNFKYKNGESIQDQVTRVKEFLDDTKLEDNTLIVSHGGTIKSLLKNLLNIEISDARQYKTGNTCLYILKKKEKSIEFELENCLEHLQTLNIENNSN